MEGHYTYFNHLISPSIPHAAEWQKFSLAIILGLSLVLLGRLASRRLATSGAESSSIVPEERISLFGFFDFFIEGFIKFSDSVLGKEGRKYIPFTGTVFLYILASNLIGLIPGMPALTTTVWVNVGMALVVFMFFNSVGVKEHGFIGYLKHFCEPVLFLAPFLFPLEVFSAVLRILTLNLRLYWNISADHMVVDIFTSLLGPIFPIPLYVLGIFVCFMQAFIFTTLTMVYILLASRHEHGEEH